MGGSYGRQGTVVGVGGYGRGTVALQYTYRMLRGCEARQRRGLLSASLRARSGGPGRLLVGVL